jgi:NAD(P)-dependent dehydrogenase (short-subunit alcohol dehydrogenase family)
MQLTSGQVAVVTGAANGIGLALSKELLSQGMKVVMADIRADEIRHAADLLSSHGEVRGVPTDVSDVASVEHLAAVARSEFGGVHLLCNNAGVGGYQRFSTIGPETWRWTLGVNLWGVINGCSVFLPLLAEQKESHIVNVASMAGFSTSRYLSPYVVSKHGVVALTECLAAEFEIEFPHVGVSVVCPAYTDTKISEDEGAAPSGHVERSIADPSLEGYRQIANDNKANGQSPEDVASIIVAGVAENRMHVFPQPEWIPRIMQRPAAILAREYPLPYAPHVPVTEVAPPPINPLRG